MTVAAPTVGVSITPAAATNETSEAQEIREDARHTKGEVLILSQYQNNCYSCSLEMKNASPSRKLRAKRKQGLGGERFGRRVAQGHGASSSMRMVNAVEGQQTTAALAVHN